MIPSKEDLLATAQRYWRADKEYDSKLENPPEYVRLCELWDQKIAKIDQWWAFLDDLERDLPEFTIGDGTATINACFRCLAYSGDKNPRRFAVVGCMSILAPIYTVYGVQYEVVGRERRNVRVCVDPLPDEMRFPAIVIARKLESTFEIAPLPQEIADTPIPLIVHWKEPPDTTLFHALFASEPDRIP